MSRRTKGDQPGLPCPKCGSPLSGNQERRHKHVTRCRASTMEERAYFKQHHRWPRRSGANHSGLESAGEEEKQS